MMKILFDPSRRVNIAKIEKGGKAEKRKNFADPKATGVSFDIARGFFIPKFCIRTHHTPGNKPKKVDYLDALVDWVPDEKTRKSILADNPAKLYDFNS